MLISFPPIWCLALHSPSQDKQMDKHTHTHRRAMCVCNVCILIVTLVWPELACVDLRLQQPLNQPMIIIIRTLHDFHCRVQITSLLLLITLFHWRLHHWIQPTPPSLPVSKLRNSQVGSCFAKLSCWSACFCPQMRAAVCVMPHSSCKSRPMNFIHHD